MRPLVSRVPVLLALLCAASLALAQRWQPLADDGLHDPSSPGVRQLQQPAEALGLLPADTAGNLVRWVPALRERVIEPRAKINPQVNTRVYDKDVYLNLRGSMPAVRFPHKAHTEWLDCTNCHDHLFKRQRGATQISMFLILQGMQCGQCHGAVAFPLTECARCHSTPREVARERVAEQEAEPAPPETRAMLESLEKELATRKTGTGAGAPR